jgi:hypothetical protein
MQNIVKLLIGCVAAAGMALPASAGITLSLTPASQTVGLDGSETFDVNVSGLFGSYNYSGPALGGYNIVLDYNPSITSPVSATFSSALNVDANGDFSLSDLGVSTPGQIVLDDFSFGTVAALEQAQAPFFPNHGASGSMTLAYVTLEGIADGTMPLTFDPTTSLSDANGSTLDVITESAASLTVVPERSCFGALEAAAALGLGMFHRKLRAVVA